MGDQKQKYYYYCFSFFGTHASGRGQSYGTVYTGLRQKIITVPMIENAKREAQMSLDSVLLAASYLGYMTADDCNTWEGE